MRAPETTFGQQLRRLRLQRGLSQEALAERAGLTPRAVSALEGGARRRPYPRTVALLADALGLAGHERAEFDELADPSVPSGPTAPAPRLPVWPTALIGRDAEVAAAAALLDPASAVTRLLTLVGPGGVGKTRLALAVAGAVTHAFADGVVLVDLAPLRDRRLVPATIAHALGVREREARSARDLLLDYLRQRQALLVLDNFEHLLDAAPLLTELMAGCPRLALLVTSRTALRLRPERRFPVAPLAAMPAVHLFVEQARAATPSFRLAADNAEVIRAICRRLDGLPLAIELAAARIGLLQPETLLRRLDHRLPLLTGGAADLPERQRTLRGALTWSHDLLAGSQRILFRRLAVFAGGWTLEAAEAICADTELAADDVLEYLGFLEDASLVRKLGEASHEPRFGMLETIREYAQEQLEAAGEAPVVARRHLEWHLALAESGVPFEPSTEQIERLAQAQDNLRVALRWSVEAREVHMALRLGVALYPLWYTRGQYTEGRAWLAELLALPGASVPTAIRAMALAWAGHLASLQGMLSEAEVLLRDGLATAQTVGDLLAQATCWQILGSLARRRGALVEAEKSYQQSLAFARSAENRVQEAWAAYLVAYLRYELGDAGGVRAALAEAAQLSAVETYPRLRARILRLEAWLAALDGEYQSALALEEQSLALLHRLGDQQGLASGNLEAARRALDRGEWQRAASHFSATLTIGCDTGDKLALAQGLEGVAQLVAIVQPEEATRLFSAAEMVRKTFGLARTPLDKAWLESWLARADRQLADAVFTTAGEALQHETLQHAIARALDLAEARASEDPAREAENPHPR
jgi:predicted ATPase/DNA-binding XRE family transcriptional regulator